MPNIRSHRSAKSALAAALVLSALAATPAHAISRSTWSDASTVGAGGLLALGLGLPILQSDMPGLGQAALSIGVGTGAAYGLKQLVHEERPDHSGNDSFPSAHSALSFAAAASLENRYGWKVGLPAFALATFVGTARVEAKKHHWYDVVAGAGLGSAAGFLLTSKRDDRVSLTPWSAPGGGGLAMSMRF